MEQNHLEPAPISNQQSKLLPTWVRWLVRGWSGLHLVLLGGGFTLLLTSINYTSSVFIGTPLSTLNLSTVTILILSGVVASEFYVTFALCRLSRWSIYVVFTRALLLLSTAVLATYFFTSTGSLLLFSVIWCIVAGIGFYYRQAFNTSVAPKRRQFLRYLAGFIYVAFLVPAFTYMIVSIIFPDLDDPGDQDLILQPMDLPAGTNAYEIMRFPESSSMDALLIEEVVTWREQYLAGNTTATSTVTEMLIELTPYSENFREASAADFYVCPSTFNDFTMEAKHCELTAIRTGGLVLLADGVHAAANGNLAGAIEDTLTVIKIGQIIHKNPQPLLIDNLVGVALKHAGLEQLDFLLSNYELSTPSLQQIATRLPMYQAEEEAFVRGFRAEHTRSVNTIEPVLRAAGKPTYWIQPNHTRNMFADNMRKNIAYFTEETCESYEKRSRQHDKALAEQRVKAVSLHMSFDQNAIGKLLFRVTAASFGSVRQETCELDTLSERVQAKARAQLTLLNASEAAE